MIPVWQLRFAACLLHPLGNADQCRFFGIIIHELDSLASASHALQQISITLFPGVFAGEKNENIYLPAKFVSFYEFSLTSGKKKALVCTFRSFFVLVLIN